MFGLSIDKMAEKFIETFFLNIIKPFGVKELMDAVNENVSLLSETAKYNPGALALAGNMAKKFNNQKQHLTDENVLSWLRDKRPELYLNIITDAKMRLWLKTQVYEFRTFLFE